MQSAPSNPDKHTIITLSQRGKSVKDIAEFLDVHVLHVRAVLDPFYMEKKREAAEARRLRKVLLRPTARYRHGSTDPRYVLQQKGDFLQSQEGREALERISRPYEPVLPESIRLRSLVSEGRPALFSGHWNDSQ